MTLLGCFRELDVDFRWDLFIDLDLDSVLGAFL